jgi:hypothetical protein
MLPQPEGWGYFYGQPRGARRTPATLSGDGHLATKVDRMKQTEDANFLFRFTFVETDHGKGFVTHYRPKHPPLSEEIAQVFGYLGLHKFAECPEFDFEQCYFRTLRFEQRGDGYFDTNVEYAHRCFDAHAGQFSRGIESLLAANATVENVGLPFLKIGSPGDRDRIDIAKRISGPPPKPTSKPVRMAFDAALPTNFDVAISFAGTERELAEELAKKLRDAGIEVFYDNFYPEHLWGKNLTAFLDEIYRKRSKFCVVFVSREYRDRKWTSHELRSAQARALEAKGEEYILPIKVDDTELDGLPPTVGYVAVSAGMDQIAKMLVSKLGR